jgi:methyl-accepting chemotaxis protein
MLPMIIKTLVLATIFNAILVITLTIYMSHRIAGPHFRICRDLEAFTDGDLKMTFRTRKTDELKPLVASLGDMGESFRARFSDIKKKCEELKRLAGDPGAGKETLAKKVEELGREIDWFKT